MHSRIGLIANHGKVGAAELVREIVAACKAFVALRPRGAHRARSSAPNHSATPSDLVRDCELLVVLGGDGIDSPGASRIM